MELQKNPQHIVWLDVVRFVAMFTVVCCHCTDPFNFYPGTAPNIDEIKLWGAIYGALLRPCVPLFVMITGALLLPVRGEVSVFIRNISPVFMAIPHLVGHLQPFPLDHGCVGHQTGSYSRLFPLFGRRSNTAVAGYFAGLYCPDTFQFFDCRCTHVVYLPVDRFVSLPSCFFCLGRESVG